jgi:hypothetical protein
MKNKLIERRDQLKEELAKGQARLAEQEENTQKLRETMLRISGAVQVLEELISAQEVVEPEKAEAAAKRSA